MMIEKLNHEIIKEHYLNDLYKDEKILLYLINKHIDEHKYFVLNNLYHLMKDVLMGVTKKETCKFSFEE